MADYCDLQYPVVCDYYNGLWDALKHKLYLILSVLIGGIAYFKAESKYKIVTIANDVFLSLLILGIIPTMILEKDQNRFKPHEAGDYYLLAVSLIIGIIITYARKTKTDTD